MSEQSVTGAEDPSAPTFRLIYRSRSLLPPESRKAELGRIFTVARSNNTSRSITGALLMYDDKFAQTLEGDEAAVRDVYARIATDPRHEALEVIESGIVDGRIFSRWAMAQVGEHHEADIPLIANTTGITAASGRASSPEQDKVLDRMRDATRGFGRGF